jgi:hypothetical protein
MESLILIEKLIVIGKVILIIESVGIFFALVWSISLFLIWLDMNKI